MVDFSKIKENVRIEDCIPMLGLTMKQNGAQYRGPCPSCQKGGDRALAITTKDRNGNESFYCFGSGGEAKGDVINLVAHIKGISPKDAAELLGGRPAPKPSKMPQDERKGFAVLDYLEPEHEAVDVLGFDVEIAKKIGLGYAPKGILKGKVAIPVRLPDGTLFGYVGVDDVTLPASFRGANIVDLKSTA